MTTEFKGWQQNYNGTWIADCGVLRLAVWGGAKGARWSVGDTDYSFADGFAPDLATAKLDAIRCAEKVIAETSALVTQLKRAASAPCKCGTVARKGGKCLRCGAEILS